jgi:hypothetical protein
VKINAACILAGSPLAVAIGVSVAVLLSLVLAAFHLIPPVVSVALAKECALAALGAGTLLTRRLLRH